MAVISAIVGAALAVGHALAGFFGGIGAGLGIGAFGGAGAGVAGAGFGWGSIAAGAAVVGGAVAAGTAGIVSLNQSARAAEKAQKSQQEYLKKLSENSGQLDVNKTGRLTDSNARINRTLSSLRVGMIPQKQTNEEIVNNAYGVDTNTVATATQNMTGLNIAT